MYLYSKKECLTLFKKLIIILILVTFSITSVASPSYAQMPIMPVPGTMVSTSPAYVPMLLKGMTVHPDAPLEFDFIIDSGHSEFSGEEIASESKKLINYFLASLTVPEDDLWVNLSPYEKDRIVPSELGKTDLGRDLLAQDYLLKQLTASLMYPEEELGQKFWNKVYEQAEKKFGTIDIPQDTFSKVWILPESATVYENENTVYIVESKLKVMTDIDYSAMQNNLRGKELRSREVEQVLPLTSAQSADQQGVSLTSQIIKEIIIPAIEEEINHGKNFAPLRQIYHSLILAQWYKDTIKNSILNQVYVDKNKVEGLRIKDKENAKENSTLSINSSSLNVEKIYEQYIEAYKKGVYNYIKEDYDVQTQQIIPKKYFSGGFFGSKAERTSAANNIVPDVVGGRTVKVALDPQREDKDQSMIASLSFSSDELKSHFLKGVEQGFNAFAAIKPDGVEHRERIMAALKEAGFEIIIGTAINLTGEQAREFYKVHEGKPFFETELIPYITSGPIIPLLLKSQSKDAIVSLTQARETIRKDLKAGKVENRIHGADTTESAIRETTLIIDFVRKSFPVHMMYADTGDVQGFSFMNRSEWDFDSTWDLTGQVAQVFGVGGLNFQHISGFKITTFDPWHSPERYSAEEMSELTRIYVGFREVGLFSLAPELAEYTRTQDALGENEKSINDILKTYKALPLLLSGLRDSRKLVRSIMATALAINGSEKALPYILAAIAVEEEEPIMQDLIEAFYSCAQNSDNQIELLQFFSERLQVYTASEAARIMLDALLTRTSVDKNLLHYQPRVEIKALLKIRGYVPNPDLTSAREARQRDLIPNWILVQRFQSQLEGDVAYYIDENTNILLKLQPSEKLPSYAELEKRIDDQAMTAGNVLATLDGAEAHIREFLAQGSRAAFNIERNFQEAGFNHETWIQYASYVLLKLNIAGETRDPITTAEGTVVGYKMDISTDAIVSFDALNEAQIRSLETMILRFIKQSLREDLETTNLKLREKYLIDNDELYRFIYYSAAINNMLSAAQHRRSLILIKRILDTFEGMFTAEFSEEIQSIVMNDKMHEVNKTLNLIKLIRSFAQKNSTDYYLSLASLKTAIREGRVFEGDKFTIYLHEWEGSDTETFVFHHIGDDNVIIDNQGHPIIHDDDQARKIDFILKEEDQAMSGFADPVFALASSAKSAKPDMDAINATIDSSMTGLEIAIVSAAGVGGVIGFIAWIRHWKGRKNSDNDPIHAEPIKTKRGNHKSMLVNRMQSEEDWSSVGRYSHEVIGDIPLWEHKSGLRVGDYQPWPVQTGYKTAEVKKGNPTYIYVGFENLGLFNFAPELASMTRSQEQLKSNSSAIDTILSSSQKILPYILGGLKADRSVVRLVAVQVLDSALKTQQPGGWQDNLDFTNEILFYLLDLLSVETDKNIIEGIIDIINTHASHEWRMFLTQRVEAYTLSEAAQIALDAMLTREDTSSSLLHYLPYLEIKGLIAARGLVVNTDINRAKDAITKKKKLTWEKVASFSTSYSSFAFYFDRNTGMLWKAYKESDLPQTYKEMVRQQFHNKYIYKRIVRSEDVTSAVNLQEPVDGRVFLTESDDGNEELHEIRPGILGPRVGDFIEIATHKVVRDDQAMAGSADHRPETRDQSQTASVIPANAGISLKREFGGIDYAQTADSKTRGIDSSLRKELGGIDLNNIEIERKSYEDHKILFDNDALEPLLDANITGFAPIIIDIIPLPSIMPILGLKEIDSDKRQATDDNNPEVLELSAFIKD